MSHYAECPWPVCFLLLHPLFIPLVCVRRFPSSFSQRAPPRGTRHHSVMSTGVMAAAAAAAGAQPHPATVSLPPRQQSAGAPTESGLAPGAGRLARTPHLLLTEPPRAACGAPCAAARHAREAPPRRCGPRFSTAAAAHVTVVAPTVARIPTSAAPRWCPARSTTSPAAMSLPTCRHRKGQGGAGRSSSSPGSCAEPHAGPAASAPGLSALHCHAPAARRSRAALQC